MLRYLEYAVLVLLVLLSLAAGGAKLITAPQEVQFFADAGIEKAWLYPLGAIQVVGSLAAIYPGTRKTGLLAIAVGFLISSVVIFITGNATFGFVSLIPAGLTLLIRARI